MSKRSARKQVKGAFGGKTQRKLKPRGKKVYDPLELKSLIEDYLKAEKLAGNEIPRQIARAVIVENLQPALIRAFEEVTNKLQGVDLLIAQHALATFEFRMSNVIDAEGRPITAGNPLPGSQPGDPDMGEPQ